MQTIFISTLFLEACQVTAQIEKKGYSSLVYVYTNTEHANLRTDNPMIARLT